MVDFRSIIVISPITCWCYDMVDPVLGMGISAVTTEATPCPHGANWCLFITSSCDWLSVKITLWLWWIQSGFDVASEAGWWKSCAKIPLKHSKIRQKSENIRYFFYKSQFVLLIISELEVRKDVLLCKHLHAHAHACTHTHTHTHTHTQTHRIHLSFPGPTKPQ